MGSLGLRLARPPFLWPLPYFHATHVLRMRGACARAGVSAFGQDWPVSARASAGAAAGGVSACW